VSSQGPTRRDDSGGRRAKALRPAAITFAMLALAALALALLEPVREGIGDALGGDTASLREDLDKPAGAAIVLALALLHAVVWYPAEILDAAAGYVFGFGPATALVMAGWLLNGLVCWLVGRHAARPLLVRWLGERRFARYEQVVARGGATLLLGMRLVPVVPFSLFSYAAGSARVPLGRFLWTTAVGYLPLTALFTYLGSRLEELRLDDPLLWAGALLLLGLLLLTRRVLRLLGEGPQHTEQ
jgi:uncharacterized membrane protein YdjX (TVP38/TMEM64 family)